MVRRSGLLLALVFVALGLILPGVVAAESIPIATAGGVEYNGEENITVKGKAEIGVEIPIVRDIQIKGSIVGRAGGIRYSCRYIEDTGETQCTVTLPNLCYRLVRAEVEGETLKLYIERSGDVCAQVVSTRDVRIRGKVEEVEVVIGRGFRFNETERQRYGIVKAVLWPCILRERIEEKMKAINSSGDPEVVEARLKAMELFLYETGKICKALPESCLKIMEEKGRMNATEFAEYAEECMNSEVFEELMDKIEEFPCIAWEVYGRMAKVHRDEDFLRFSQELRKECLKEKKFQILPVMPPQICTRCIKIAAMTRETIGRTIATAIGELELQKYRVLMSKNISKEEKQRIVKEIEMQKRKIIREIIEAAIKHRNRTIELPETVEVSINESNISIEGEEVNSSTVKEIKIGRIKIEVDRRAPKIIADGLEIKVRARVKVVGDNIAVGNRVVKPPEEILKRIRMQVKEMEIEEKGEKPVYIARGVRKVRILGIIPVEITVEAEIDAENGTVIRMKRPWWAFLAV